MATKKKKALSSLRVTQKMRPPQLSKKQLYLLGGVSFICLAAIAYVIGWHRPDIALTKQSLIIEYGTVVTTKPADLLNTTNQTIKQSATFDSHTLKYASGKKYPEVGRYTIQLLYVQKRKQMSKPVSLIVRDTTPPAFSEAKDIELEQDAQKPDYQTLISAKDLSKITLTVDETKVDYKTPGEYPLTITAKDSFGNSSTQEITVRVTAKPVASANPSQANPGASAESPTYVNGILIVNKKHPLPSNYNPGEIPEAGSALRRLIADMQAQGFQVSNDYSGFRSYSYQTSLYNNYPASERDTYSARPGYSEHQSGLAFDLKNSSGGLLNESGGDATAAAWVAQHAHEYGFIVRYQAGKESVTGYMPEPWHLRYLGAANAGAVYSSGLSLEEYLSVPGGDY